MNTMEQFLTSWGSVLVDFRRDLHAHPELGREETRTTERIAELLRGAGLSPQILPTGTGLLCDIGSSPTVGLRADIDALPLTDVKEVDYRSTVRGVCHACGHDVHTTVVAGTGVYLAGRAAEGKLPRGVRLIFQPAEELMPGGAPDVIAAGGVGGPAGLFAAARAPGPNGRAGRLRSGPGTAAPR